MKKILFVLDFIYSGHTTNIKLAQSVANCLKQGYDVWFLCNAEKNPMPTENVILFKTYADKCSYDVVNRVRAKGGGAVKTAVELLKKPEALQNVITTVMFKYSLAEVVFKREIERACKQQNFDVVITVSCPHYAMFALAKSNVNAQKIAYIMDPYYGNATMSYAVSQKKELDFYASIDHAVITEQMHSYYKKNKFAKYLYKMTVAEFPALCKKENATNHTEEINCVFVGNLYPKLRDPKFLFELAQKLDDSITLSFTGGGYSGFPTGYLDGFVKRLNGRLTLNPAVDSNSADEILASADVLINIGNNAENQLPSKVIEYLGYGKPILNIYKIDSCPSLKYYNNYSLALNVKENNITEKMVNIVNEFLLNSKNKRLPYGEVKHLFMAATPEYVADQFDAIIEGRI